MEISSGFLLVGAFMSLAGALLIYKSLKAGPNDIANKNSDIRYVGRIPIIVNGESKWIITAFIISSFIIIYLITISFFPDIFGGIFNG